MVLKPGQSVRLTLHGDMWAYSDLMIRPRGGVVMPEGVTVARDGVAVSADDRLMALAGYDGPVRLYDLHTLDGLRTITPKNGFKVTAVAFGPDGRRLVTGSADKTATVWGPAD